MSARIDAAKAAILEIAQATVSDARVEAISGPEVFSCVIVVGSDHEKHRINNDSELLNAMKAAAAKVGRAPDHLTAESQETVDRRFAGDWQAVWR
jgi:hypothetical protein